MAEKRALTIAAPFAALVMSCLFPSIDALEGDGKRPPPGSGDGGEGEPGRQFVQCGERNCVVGFQVCCDTLTETVCRGIGMCNAVGESHLDCDGIEDCDGGVCCMLDEDTVECRPSCEGTAKVMCTSDAAQCPSGTTCREVADLAGHKACF